MNDLIFEKGCYSKRKEVNGKYIAGIHSQPFIFLRAASTQYADEAVKKQLQLAYLQACIAACNTIDKIFNSKRSPEINSFELAFNIINAAAEEQLKAFELSEIDPSKTSEENDDNS